MGDGLSTQNWTNQTLQSMIERDEQTSVSRGARGNDKELSLKNVITFMNVSLLSFSHTWSSLHSLRPFDMITRRMDMLV